MGFWGGVERGLEVAKKDQLNKDQMELASRREERAEATFKLREDEAALQRMKDIRGMFSGGGGFEALSIGSGGGTSKSTGETTEHMMNVLGNMGVDDDVLVTLSASGGTPAAGRRNLSKAYAIATKYNTGARSGNYQVDETGVGEVITQMINDAVYTQSKEIPLNDDFWTNFEESSSMTISESERNTLGESYTQPGYVTFTKQPVLRDKATISDIEKAQGFVNRQVVTEATNESNLIFDLENTIVGLEGNGPPYGAPGATDAQEEFLADRIRHLKLFAQTRQAQLFEATEKAKSDNYNGLYNIYGSSDILEPIFDLIGQFDPIIMGEQFLPRNQVPMNVGNGATYAELEHLGILKKGQIVTYEELDEDPASPTFGQIVPKTEVVGS